jgi:hypothetical protein
VAVLATAIGSAAGVVALTRVRGGGGGAAAWLPGTSDIGAFGPDGDGFVLATAAVRLCRAAGGAAAGVVEAGGASAAPD